MASTSTDSVRLTSRHTVRCANENSWKPLDSPYRLAALDQLVLPFIPIAVVFVYSATPQVAEPIPVERLKTALTLLLDYYPHLTGRLQINPNDGTSEITSLGTGAELLAARCSERLDAFSSPSSPSRVLMSNLPAGGNALFAPFDGNIEAVCRGPILTVQHTRFACGGVALGMRILHTVCDADGFFQLARDLAELYRGVGSPGMVTPSLVQPPHVRPYLSDIGDVTPEDRQAALDFKSTLYYVEPSVADAPSSSTIPASSPPAYLPPVVGRFMRFSSREISALKALATDPTRRQPSSGGWISTFDALSAHLYQRIYRARVQLRVQDPDQGELSPPDFLAPFNLRSRLGHDCFPPRYFHNALFTAYTSLPLSVLASGPLWQVAKALHDMMCTPPTTSQEQLKQTLKWIAVQPDKRKIKSGFRYGNGAIMISQWNKFDMYAGCVFDEDPPVLVSTPFTPISLIDGLAYFLPTMDDSRGTAGGGGEAGAVDVALALSEPLWAIIDQDEPII